MEGVVIEELAGRMTDELIVDSIEVLKHLAQIVLVLLLNLQLRDVIHTELQVWLVLLFHPPALQLLSSTVTSFHLLQIWTLLCCLAHLRIRQLYLARIFWKFEFHVRTFLYLGTLIIRVELGVLVVVLLRVVYLILTHLRLLLKNTFPFLLSRFRVLYTCYHALFELFPHFLDFTQ